MCSWFPADDCAFSISPELSTKGWVSNSNVCLELNALSLYKLNISDPLTNVNVNEGVLPASSDANIDFTITVDPLAAVITEVRLVVVRSTLAFL